MRQASFGDFSRGYDLRTPHELMKPGDLTKADNCVWDDEGLVSRKGHVSYITSGIGEDDQIRGFSKRYYLRGKWVQFIAIDDNSASYVLFYTRDTVSISALGSQSHTFTTGNNVHFAEIDGKIIATNGVDPPMIITWSGTRWEGVRYDTADTKTWDVTIWDAGQYWPDTSYVDDTTDAQSDDLTDFPFAGSTNIAGFWVACANPFTKIVLYNAQQLSNVSAITYSYWSSATDTWANFTPTTPLDLTAVNGHRTVEWACISALKRYDGDEEAIPTGYYVIRIIIGQTVDQSYKYCQKLEISHTHYLSEAIGGTIPQICIAHNSRMFLSADNKAYFSPPNSMYEFRGESESEYFLEGGPQIRAMASYKNMLFVFKDSATYVFYGTTVEDFYRKKVSDYGITSATALVVTDVGIFYLSADGMRVTNGDIDVRVSNHINDELLDFDSSEAVGIYHNGVAYVSFPNESTGIVLRFDPATLEVDDKTGEGRVAFYKYTVYQANFYVSENGTGDTGFLFCASNDGGNSAYIAKLESVPYDTLRGSSTKKAISFDARTPYLSLGNLAKKKRHGRLVLTFIEGSAAITATIELGADKGDRTVSTTVILGTDGRDHVSEMRAPYQMDGRSINVKITMSATVKFGFRGFALEYETMEL